MLTRTPPFNPVIGVINTQTPVTQTDFILLNLLKLSIEIQNQWERIFINGLNNCYEMNMIKQAAWLDIKEYLLYYPSIQMRCRLTSLKPQIFL